MVSLTLMRFGSAPPSVPNDSTPAPETTDKRTFGKYTVMEEDIKGSRRGADGLMLMAYTCGKCEE